MKNRLKVALTHDIDRTEKTYQYLTNSISALKKLDFSKILHQIRSFKLCDQVYWNFDEIINIENKYGVKSTFFFQIESIPFHLYEFNK
ncbi:MAG TPA: hypothetical protein DHV28_00880 [Ignavibacteriales bacterium]|nr:hypothetical protein [Ignavibacteriales bacterium]